MEEYIRVDLTHEWMNKGKIPVIVDGLRRDYPEYEFLAFNGNDAVMKLKPFPKGDVVYPEKVLSPYMTVNVSDEFPKLDAGSTYKAKRIDKNENPPEYIYVPCRDWTRVKFVDVTIMNELRKLEEKYPLYQFVQQFGPQRMALMRLRKPVDVVSDMIKNATEFKPEYKLKGFDAVPEYRPASELKDAMDTIENLYPHAMKEYNIEPENSVNSSGEDKKIAEVIQSELDRLRKLNRKPKYDKILFPNAHLGKNTTFMQSLEGGMQHALDKWNASGEKDPKDIKPEDMLKDSTPIKHTSETEKEKKHLDVNLYCVYMIDADGIRNKRNNVRASSPLEAINLTRHDDWWYDHGNIKYPVTFTTDLLSVPKRLSFEEAFSLSEAVIDASKNDGVISSEFARRLVENQTQVRNMFTDYEWMHVEHSLTGAYDKDL